MQGPHLLQRWEMRPPQMSHFISKFPPGAGKALLYQLLHLGAGWEWGAREAEGREGAVLGGGHLAGPSAFTEITLSGEKPPRSLQEALWGGQVPTDILSGRKILRTGEVAEGGHCGGQWEGGTYCASRGPEGREPR